MTQMNTDANPPRGFYPHPSASSVDKKVFRQLRLCCAAFICGLTISANAQPASLPSEPVAASAKYLLYEFFSYKTMDSKVLRETVINSGPASEIIKESYQLIPVEQGKDSEKESLYKITYYPTLIIAQPDGTEVDRIIGSRRPEEVAATLKAAAAGQPQIARVREAAAASSAGIREHMTLATALRLRDDPEGALKEYVWMLANGEAVDPRLYESMYRLILQQMASLGKRYSPALDELSKRRDVAVKAAEADKPASGSLERAFALNEALGTPASNVSLYLKIPADNPLKQRLFPEVFLTLVREKKYQEAAGIADLEDFIGHMYPSFREKSGEHAHDGHQHVQGRRALKQKINTYTLAACETLLALGEIEKAKRVAGHAIDYLGKDNQNLIARLNYIATQSGTSAKDFSSWLAAYAQPTKPKSP